MIAAQLAGNFQVPPLLDLVAVILLAITGALSAAKRGYDWIGTMAIAFITGCGGGLIRDMLLNVRPVILEHELYLWTVIGAVFLTTYFSKVFSRVPVVFLVADALGLAMYAVIGTQKALEAGLGVTAAILIGTLNGVGGALIRDILAREEASILKPGQWEAGIAFCASASFGLLGFFTDFPRAVIGLVVVVAAFFARLIAQRYNLRTRPFMPVGFETSRGDR